MMDFFTGWSIYSISALVGGTILSLQLILVLLGGDHSFDSDADVDSHEGMGLISVRSIASFLTFFGLFGLWGQQKGWSEGASAALGISAGVLVMLLVAWVMAQYRKLDSSGNLEPDRAVGKTATVYLTVPAANQGRGKITVSLQGRTEEYQAMTAGPALSTGQEVCIRRMIDSTTFEVSAPEQSN